MIEFHVQTVPMEIVLSRLQEREGLKWGPLSVDGHLEVFTYTVILYLFILRIFADHPWGARLCSRL